MIEVKVPELGESITEGTIADWAVKKGDRVSRGDILAELETDKVNLEINAEHSGILQDIRRTEGETVQVGEVIAWIAESGQSEEGEADVESGNAGKTSAESGDIHDHKEPAEHAKDDEGRTERDAPPLAATPAARRKARHEGIDLHALAARDPLGRIAKKDVAHEERSETERTAPEATPEERQFYETEAQSDRPVERKRMSRRRQTIARHLVEAQHNAAMLTTFNEVDMTAILKLRERRKRSFQEQHGIKLGFMSFFAKAVVGALKSFPLLNAEIQDDEIVIKKYYDIGIAVAAEDGLVVPVVRHADRLNFAGLEKNIAELAEKARQNRLQLADLQGGTFTITNGGVFGSLLSTPILNAPQVGILGMHQIQTRPVTVDNDRMENRPMMYVALSYDHRIVDGREAVQFLVRVKELLEDPETLLLEG